MLIATVPYVGKRLHLDPDPDPDPKLITDPDPNMQIISDPAGSGSGSTTLPIIFSIFIIIRKTKFYLLEGPFLNLFDTIVEYSIKDKNASK